MAQLGQIRTGTAAADTVRARMRELGDRPPAHEVTDGLTDGLTDGVGVFHRLYLAVTEQAEQSALPDLRPASPLELRCAERYLAVVDAVRNGRRPAASWRPVFQYRRHPGVRPLQFALAGINAHVGHDLALAVVDTCHALDCEPADLEGEFDRVGALLGTLEERIHEDLLPGGPDLLLIADPLAHLLGGWNLERARDAAWSTARVLFGLRQLPDLAEEFTQRTDAGVGLVGHCLLTPWR
ncbi:DUF5995 family protein [Streptomyces boluensis]|uniref:Uncharacterized protein n=1 Tax=Streptomyces boluensis TaxID=1775135 RepID=A0A964UX45_9ACTN|nr:DUF5995 family protein [Streptomyces boluensis]NBE55910.1 hypothetical protein [Streptomyces boluensis]